ncbi:glutamine--fructose-6-phosphate transaminase (isomerizing) [bacterium]|nr:glutamine--fructose-6-phosphate transaminase (isomerizing) [bacterium]
MCGIIGYIGSQKVLPVLIEGLKKLEYRGYDSAGIAVAGRRHVRLCRVKGKISDLEKKLNQESLDGNYGLGHTRWATHGRPSEENAHPHQDCTGSFVVVHNGIIENYLSLKKELINEGHAFQTETDTEVIAHLVEKYFEENLGEAVQRAIQDLKGAFSLAVLSPLDWGKIVIAKMGPPAVVGINEGEYFISSDINPLLSHTRNIVFLEDQEMAVVTKEGFQFFDFEGKAVEKKVEQLSWTPLMIEKRGFKHFMLKEIYEQPQVVRDTISGRFSLESKKLCLDELGLSPQKLKHFSRVVILACGTSYHAGLVGKYFIESLSGIPTDIEYASEYRYRDFILDRNSLVLVISQSGETADTLAALREIKKQKCASLAVTNVPKSSIAREAQGVLLTHAGPEIGVAATKTFSAQLTALALTALYLAQVKGKLKEKDLLTFFQQLQRIPHLMESILGKAKSIQELAQRYHAYSHFLYLGRWVSFPVALEGALKLKEISYIHAEGYPSGEMKHGPIALIDEKMPSMVIIPRDRVYEKMMSNISEIKTRVGCVLAVASEDDREILSNVDEVIPVPSVHPLFTPFLTTLPLQLFAYYIAAIRGVDIDQPRNLAKSVTVE